MTPEDIVAQLGGHVVSVTVIADGDGCPLCGAATERSPAGHRTLCPDCTQRELPGTALDNSLRIEAGLTWAGYWRRVESYGTPWSNPKAWTSKRTKIKR